MGNTFAKEANVKNEVNKHLVPKLANIVHDYCYDNINLCKQRIIKYLSENAIEYESNIYHMNINDIVFDAYYIAYDNDNIMVSFHPNVAYCEYVSYYYVFKICEVKNELRYNLALMCGDTIIEPAHLETKSLKRFKKFINCIR